MSESRELLSLTADTFKLLIGGYININVIDGSAFFLSGLTSMCARQPAVDVSLVTANPVEKTEVLHEVLHCPNVSIIDPYKNLTIQARTNAPSGNSMTREQYAEVLGFMFISQEYDALIVRDTEVGFLLTQKFPKHAEQFSVYVTGVTSLDENSDTRLLSQLSAIVASGARLVSQTDSMAKVIASLDIGVDLNDIFILPPHIPDAEASFDASYHAAERPAKLAYTGKFFKAWNADKILASFKAIKRSLNPDLTLEVAGDQFRRDPDDPYFVDNVKHLLISTDGLVWHGRVPRAKSREIIARSHVGIGWRAAELDNSTELSTKILEYGAMGRPSILNRNALHEELLGTDYPLFANSTTEFKELLTNLGGMASEVEEAARRCYELSRSHWYSTVLPSLLDHLGNSANSDSDYSVALGDDMLSGIPEEIIGLGAQARLDGMWLRIRFDDSSGRTVYELIRSAQLHFSGWSKVVEYARNQLVDADVYLSDRPQSVAHSSVKTVPLAPVTADSSSVLTRLEETELRARDLEQELIELKKRHATTTTRLRALRSSKLGSLQMKIWNLRGKK